VDEASRTRARVIARTSAVGVVANLLIAAFKVAVGFSTSSLAFVSEGVNNAADALTAALAWIGTKLAGRHPDAEHPFGYGRLEYLTGLVVSVVILVSGTEILLASVRLLRNPQPLRVSVVALAVIAFAAVVKFALGEWTLRTGRRIGSTALAAVGQDGRNDSFNSVVTIGASVVFLATGKSVDAYAGLVTSVLILKSGWEILRHTVAEILGRPGDSDLARRIYARVRGTKGVLGAADMMLHNYGPDKWSGSVNVELDHSLTVGEIYALLHRLQLAIMYEEKVTMVFGVYAVDNDHEEIRKIRADVAAFVRRQEHVRSFHALYLDAEAKKLYCDLIVDYELRDWEPLRRGFAAYMKECCPNVELVLTVETEFV